MKSNRLLLGLVIAGAAAVVALNQTGTPVPVLEWLRLDTALSKIGIGETAAPSTTAAGTTAPGATADKGKRGGGNGSGGGKRWGQDGPVPVVVAASTVSDVPVYLRGVGTARAPNTVTVRPQVDGKLLKVHFKEGQDVKRGDLLAEIDPVTYQALLDQAIAKRKLTEVQLANAKLDLDRYSKTTPGVIAQKTVDTQRAQVAQFEAQVKADAAAIANAQATLDYARIVSPIDGRTGQRLVDEGNLVRSGDAGIVTIAQIHPIQVQFTLPQQQLTQVMEAMKIGPVQVEAMDGEDRNVIDSGAVAFIDNQIDQTTGTVKMKADLPNERLQLWPGQFANVRVRVDTLKSAITAPTASVQRGPQGTFVYVLKPDGAEGVKSTVAVRLVTVAQQDDRNAVIGKGLEAGEMVVTSGFARLKDATEVTVTRTEGAPGKDAPAAKELPAAAPTEPAKTSAAPETGSAGGKPKSERRQRAEGEGGKGKRGKPPESAVQ